MLDNISKYFIPLEKYISILATLSFQAPEGDTQPSTEVDLFISTEKIMVLNTDLKVSHGVIYMRRL